MKRALFLIIIVLWFQIENRDKKGEKTLKKKSRFGWRYRHFYRKQGLTAHLLIIKIPAVSIDVKHFFQHLIIKY